MITIAQQHDKDPRQLTAVGFFTNPIRPGFSPFCWEIAEALNLDYLWEGNDEWGQDEAKFLSLAQEGVQKPYHYCDTFREPLPEYRHMLMFAGANFLARSRFTLIELIRGLHIQQLMRKKQVLIESVRMRDMYDPKGYRPPIVEDLYRELMRQPGELLARQVTDRLEALQGKTPFLETICLNFP